jgi:hypothetical protein
MFDYDPLALNVVSIPKGVVKPSTPAMTANSKPAESSPTMKSSTIEDNVSEK